MVLLPRGQRSERGERSALQARRDFSRQGSLQGSHETRSRLNSEAIALLSLSITTTDNADKERGRKGWVDGSEMIG
jgi:hypothetical protein